MRRYFSLVLCFVLVTALASSVKAVGPDISQTDEHGPIMIYGNEDLISTASVEGWPGTGSEESPIVISGLSITSEEFGIHITDVDLYFRIQECTITSSGNVYWCFGILLDNCSNASIEQCALWSHEFGIYLTNSDGAYVSRTEIYESFSGVFVNWSSGVWLHSLDIVVCKIGIRLNHTMFAYVDQTIIDSCEYAGFECFGDEGTLLRHNTVIGGEKGVQLVVNENWVIEESHILSCETGIEAFLTTGGYVIRSMIENCSSYGISLESTSHNVTVIENWLGPDNAQDANDDGEANFWYDEYCEQGNYWSNYSGEGPYLVPGAAESVDLFPTSLEEAPDWEYVISIDGNWTTSVQTQTTSIGNPIIDNQILFIASAAAVVVLLIAVAMTRSRVGPSIH